MALLRALGVALCGCWASFLAGFLWLPPRLNALINALAAASPLSAPYYAPAAAAVSDAAQGQLPSRNHEGGQQQADGVLQEPVDEQGREANDAAAAAAAAGGRPQAAKDEHAGGSDVDSGTDDTRMAPDQDHHGHGHDQGQGQDQDQQRSDTTSGPAPAVAASTAPPAAPAASPSVAMRLHRRALWPPTRGSPAAATDDSGTARSVGGASGGGCQGSRLVMSLEECRRRYGSVPNMDVVIMVGGVGQQGAVGCRSTLEG